MLIKKIMPFFMFFSLHTFAKSHTDIITIPSDIYENFLINQKKYEVKYKVKDLLVLEVPSQDLEIISELSHEIYNRCGGYILEKDELDAFFNLEEIDNKRYFSTNHNNLRNIKNSQTIKNILEKVDASRIKKDIASLSSFRNRYYKSRHGIASQEWLLNHWKKLSQMHDFVKVEKFNHSQFPQPSIIATIEGLDKPDEYIIIGGHGDSIAGWYPSNEVHAPGADDNASGISTLTEVFRVLLSTSLRPSKSIQFISYAAEEVGLRGSNEIAQKYYNEHKDIKGVIQLDMTNFKGSDKDMVFISDYTNAAHNQFLIKILENYLPNIKWSYDECGYACSDHVSWYRQGFPVSFPFESTFDTYNKKIHSTNDTLETLNNNAKHASNFAKLSLAYVLETAFNKLNHIF